MKDYLGPFKNQNHNSCGYLLELASAYNGFYRDCSVMRDGNVDAFHFHLSEKARRNLKLGMEALGIVALEEMRSCFLNVYPYSRSLSISSSSSVCPAASISSPIRLNSLSASSRLLFCLMNLVCGQPQLIFSSSYSDSSIQFHRHLHSIVHCTGQYPSKMFDACKQGIVDNECARRRFMAWSPITSTSQTTTLASFNSITWLFLRKVRSTCQAVSSWLNIPNPRASPDT